MSRISRTIPGEGCLGPCCPPVTGGEPAVFSPVEITPGSGSFSSLREQNPVERLRAVEVRGGHAAAVGVGVAKRLRMVIALKLRLFLTTGALSQGSILMFRGRLRQILEHTVDPAPLHWK